MQPLACIAIDDDGLFLMNLDVYLQSIDWLDLKGTYNNPIKGATAVIKVEPDVLFVDLEMPYVEGYDLVEWILPRLKFLNKKPKIVVISGSPEKMRFDHDEIFLHIQKAEVKSPEALQELLQPLRKLQS